MKTHYMTGFFDLLYMMAATGGRDTELFGGCGQLLHDAAKKALIKEARPEFYLEFPLAGKPCADLVVLYSKIPSGFKFSPGCGFGYQNMIDWYSTLPTDLGYSMGFELDVGSGMADRAGIYFQPHRSMELIKPFFKTIGEENRASSYLALSERLPALMPSAYIGLFPGRPGSPMRIGGYMSAETSKVIAQNPDFLRDAFKMTGFKAYNDEMLSLCRDLYSVAEDTDFQFDIYPDGNVGDTFGLDISLINIKPAQAEGWLKEGNGNTIMSKLKYCGLIDDRYLKLSDISFAKGIPVEREDGSTGLLGLSGRFSYIKVKFKAGKPVTAKFYLLLNAGFTESPTDYK